MIKRSYFYHGRRSQEDGTGQSHTFDGHIYSVSWLPNPDLIYTAIQDKLMEDGKFDKTSISIINLNRI
jgi:hypothetical protein